MGEAEGLAIPYIYPHKETDGKNRRCSEIT